MSKDKYSDNHTIVVDGGSGTLNVNGNLNVSGSISSSGSSDLGLLGEDIIISADRNITISGGSTEQNSSVVISSGAGFSDKGSQIELSSYTNSLVFKAGVPSSIPVTTLTDGVALVAKDDINIYAGAGSTSGIVTISANNGSTPKFQLTESTNTAAIDAINVNIPGTVTTTSIASNTLSISSPTVNINSSGSVTVQSPTINLIQSSKTVDLIIPGSSFLLSDEYGTDLEPLTTSLESDEYIVRTKNGNIKWKSNRNSEDVCRIYIVAPLPDSIPDGAIITRLGYMLDRTTGDASRFLDISILSRSYTSNSLVERFAEDGFNPTSSYEHASGNLWLDSEPTTMTIDRNNYNYSIKINLRVTFTSGGDEINYFNGAKVTYTTTKYDTNI